jgi:hypothetical protein
MRQSAQEIRLEQFNLWKLSTSFATSRSTDRRDFVYALVGIACNVEYMVPDYAKSPVQVIVDVLGHRYFASLKYNDYSLTLEEEVLGDFWNGDYGVKRTRFLAQHNYVTHLRSNLGVSKTELATLAPCY